MKILVLFWYFPAPKGVWKNAGWQWEFLILPPLFAQGGQGSPGGPGEHSGQDHSLRHRRLLSDDPGTHVSGGEGHLEPFSNWDQARPKYVSYNTCIDIFLCLPTSFYYSLQAFRNQGQITGIFYGSGKPWNHRLLTFNPSDNYHMVLSHNKVIT